MHSFTRWTGVLAACLLTTLSATASASVVYNWQTVDTTDALSDVAGQLTITDSAYRTGGFDFSYNSYDPDSSPIEALSVQLNDVIAAISPPSEFEGFEGTLDASLAIGADGVPNGSFSLNDTNAEFAMQSDSEGLWSITMAGSDDPAIGDSCFNDHASCNATGRWLLDASTVPGNAAETVAEPGNLALFALGLLVMTLIGVRRRDPSDRAR